MSKLKIGIIGCGGIANAKHLPAQKSNPDAKLVAFCDIMEERAQKAAKEYGGKSAKVFTDYRELLKEDELDAVLVCTPNCSHCEITVASLNAGKHVLCEKPMATSYEEARQMIEARDRAGKVLTIGYQNRYRPDILYLKNLADEDYFGEIYYAEANALRRRGVPTWGVFIDEAKQGGGPLIDIGTHALDLTLFLMNNYEPAYCVGRTFHKLNKQTATGNAWGDWDTERFTAEDAAFGFVVMKNGAVIYVRSSWALNEANPREACATLCGDKAGAEILDASGTALRLNGVMGGRQYLTTPDLTAGAVPFFEGTSGADPSVLEARTFTDAALGKGKLWVTAEQAATVTRILEGIYLSHKTQKPVFFD